ncbi:MAG: tyrosine-type recombinase/integrase, partial [Anaerolineales bacterium]
MTNQIQNDTGTPLHITENTHLQPTIRAWQFYLDSQGKSPYTVKAFIGDLNLLDAFLPPDKTIGEMTLRNLNDFINWLENERGVPCSPKSLSRRITAVKSFFRWLKEGGIIVNDPAEKIVQRTVSSPLPTVLTHPEMKTALMTANSFRDASPSDARPFTLLKLLLETAIKKGECRDIALNHLSVEDPDNAFVFIRYTNPSYRYK